MIGEKKMIVRKCDFCGAEGAEEIKLPQPNEEVAIDDRGNILMKIKINGFYYKNFDICPDCREKLFDLIKLLENNKNG